jgi:beta-lactamase superfamily II metal-dependent hydrolase
MPMKIKRSTARKLRIIPEIIVTAAVIAFIVLVALRYAGCIETASSHKLDDGTVAVHIIDVGQGDCILIETCDGVVLIDSGTNDSEQVVFDYLEKLNIKTVNYFIMTHAHDDHIGGADMILESFDVDRVMCGDYGYGEDLMGMIYDSECELLSDSFGTEWTLGGARFSVISPSGIDYGEDLNDHSIVIRMEYGETSFVFAGDATVNTEENILALFESGALDCDFLKSGHHGSITSSGEEFIAALSPDIVAISCGVNNSYGLPDKEVLELYESLDAECIEPIRKAVLCL